MNYQVYCEKREDWRPAIQVYNEWKEQEARRAKMTFDELLGDLTHGAISITLALIALGISDDPQTANMWITSPSGNTMAELPLYAALRIVRKRGWWFTEVEPVKECKVEECQVQ